jgi:glutaredoxin
MKGKQLQMKARVVLYTKPGCGLCEEMKEQMLLANCGDLYTLEEVNIENDAELYARYRYEIPVLFINDVEAFRHRLSADEFRVYITSLGGVAG